MTKFKQQHEAAIKALEEKIEEINNKGNVSYQDIQELDAAIRNHNVAKMNRSKYGTITEREATINNEHAKAMDQEVQRIMKEKY